MSTVLSRKGERSGACILHLEPAMRLTLTAGGGRCRVLLWLCLAAIANRPRNKKGRGKKGGDDGGDGLCSMHFLSHPLPWMQVGGEGPRAGVHGGECCCGGSADLGPLRRISPAASAPWLSTSQCSRGTRRTFQPAPRFRPVSCAV